MQTALYITDCSIDSALVLRDRLAISPNVPFRLTIVHPYDLAPDQPLNKVILREARQAAATRLTNWKTALGDTRASSLKAELLFASPELALRIHLLIRQYDAVFIDGQWILAPQELADLLAQTGTQLHYLTTDAPELTA
ncbi:hypothetical protein A6C57_05370 [Fibrella sp. ES10-3-2-2]|nr:hypothetical protein A6C57_05370 [Fibrella sp. ES10-3-2-2]